MGKFTKPTPKQAQTWLMSDSRLNVWDGAVRSGKTIGSILRWIEYVKTYPSDGPFLMCGRTITSLKRNVIDQIIDICGKSNTDYKSSTNVFKLYGKECWMVGASDSASAEKIRGNTVCGAYVDEVTIIPENFFQMLLQRCSEPNSKIFITTNPDSLTHWFKTKYLDNPDLDLSYFHFTLYDNPFLDDEYIKNIVKENTGIFYRRFILGEWCLAEGRIFASFNSEKHTFSGPIPNYKYQVCGVDYGTRNPTAFLLVGYNNIQGPYYIFDEYFYDGYKKNPKSDSEFKDDLFKFLAPANNLQNIFIDPAALSFKVELGKHNIFPNSAKNDVLDGIRFTNSLFAKDKIFIHERCKKTLEELESYSWDEDWATRCGEDRPIKLYDHTMDAMRYIFYTKFGQAQYGLVGSFNL